MTYNPKLYWEERGKHFTHSERIDELQFLESIISILPPVPASILDVGSGDGRVYSHLKKANIIDKHNYKMCDFADSFRINCFKNTGVMPDKWDGEKIRYKDNEFDRVISFCVMLHVPMDKIDIFLKEHIGVSKNILFIATWHEKDVIYNVEDYCVPHDYYNLFANNKLGILYDRDCYFDEGSFKRKNFVLIK